MKGLIGRGKCSWCHKSKMTIQFAYDNAIPPLYAEKTGVQLCKHCLKDLSGHKRLR